MLEGHARQGKRFVPPLMQYGTLAELSWHREQLPDFLWLALMLGRRSDWQAAYRPMDVIDRFVPEGDRFADGRLTSFALVPEGRRTEARDALRRETPHALPSNFGHAIGLFPACPARWLYDDWLADNKPDVAIGTRMLRDLIADNADKAGVRSTRLRMAAFSRRVTHGKVSHPGSGAFDLFPRYPGGLTAREQATVESMLRAMWIGLAGVEAEREPDRLRWPADFWLRCRDLVPCTFDAKTEKMTMEGEPDAPVDPEPVTTLAEFQRLIDALTQLGDELRDAQRTAFSKPDADEPNAVLLGFASRLYRSLCDLMERPSAWSASSVGLHLRPIVEARIVSAWLMHRDDPAIFAAYREYGLGNLKLLREHIKVDFGDEPDDEARDLLDYLDARVNLERDEWAQPVNVGSFTDVSVRRMAIECDLKRLYDLSYAPYSSNNHGEWPAIRDLDTAQCGEPLHGGHRLGLFQPSSRIIGPAGAAQALDVAEEGIGAIFEHYGTDVTAAFEPVRSAFVTAGYEPKR